MGNVKMRVWDVKHGSATYIRTPNERHIVIDLGVGDYSEQREDTSPLETIKNHYQVEKIDLLLITHPHKDHIRDILNIDQLGIAVQLFRHPKKLDLKLLLDKASENDKPLYERYQKFSSDYTTAATSEETTTIPSNNDGVSFKYFDNGTEEETNPNNHSIITVLEYEGWKIIIPGDNEYKSLDLHMQNASFKDAISNCDILIAPHHGRESAYHDEFVKHTNPKLTIISDSEKCETSANEKYSRKSSGMQVFDMGSWKTRYLITTDYDGEVYIDFGKDNDGRYMRIEVKNKIEKK